VTGKEKRPSANRTARVAGLLYLLVFPFAFFSLSVRDRLIVYGDAAATASNIMASEGLFRGGIVAWILSQTIFIFLVLALFKLLKSVNANVALHMVVLLLVGIPIALVNELNQFAALVLLSGADYLTAVKADQLHAQLMFHLDLHRYGIYIAQIFWGLWLLPFGYLVFKSGFLPRILGVLLMVGCLGHLVDVVAGVVFSNDEVAVSQFTSIGEFLFPLWLVVKGVDVQQWERRALDPA
jgi:Domain of unknown function (DUF4386)